LLGCSFLFFNLLIQVTTENEEIQQQLQELKKEVRKMLMAPGEKPTQKFKFIDAIQRLGVSYHFENEIQQILQQLHNTLHGSDDHEDDDCWKSHIAWVLRRWAIYKVEGKHQLLS
jgi:hypothetical protein